MRKGQNPAFLGKAAYQSEKLGIGTMIFVPSLDGYFENALPIFKYQLASIYETTGVDFDLLVLDNGSCQEIKDALVSLFNEGWIDWLILSPHNMGRTGGMNVIYGALQNELICYTDSDVLFRPGWFEASLKLLDTFPNAGMVAAQPVFFDVMDGGGKAHLALKSDPAFEFSTAMPIPEALDDYCMGLGSGPERRAKLMETPLSIITHKPSQTRAVVGATHMQFLARQPILKSITPLPASTALSGTESEQLDWRIDSSGHLHLSTEEALVYHMGNMIDERWLSEAKSLESKYPFLAAGSQKPLEVSEAAREKQDKFLVRFMSSLARRSFFKKFFRRVYNLMFRVLSD